MENSGIQIIEKHISEWALPKEDILSWLKWESNFDFDQLVIKLEADLQFLHILNVDDKVFKQKDIPNGKAVIDKDMLQISGFVGFTCIYNLIPESERELNFEIDFLKSNRIIDTISMKTNLIRPIVAIEHIPIEGIIISETNRQIPQLRFNLESKGRGRILNLSPFIQFVNAKAMQITMKQTRKKNEDTTPLFVASSEYIIPSFLIKGEGYGMITMGFEYQDSMGNKYESKLVDIPIHLQQKESLEVPISSDLEGQSTILLEPTVL